MRNNDSHVYSKKIIYLISQPLDQRNFNRFGIQTMLDEGWLVEVWDFTPLIYPAVWERFFAEKKQVVEMDFYIPIIHKKDIRLQLVKEGKVDYFIDLIDGHNFYYLLCKSQLLKSGAKSISLILGSIPLNDITLSFKYVLKLLKKYFFSYALTLVLIQRSINRLFFRNLLKKYKDNVYFVVSGQLAYDRAKKSVPGESNIIKAHNYDYDIYLKIQNSSDIQFNKAYAVFLDEDYPFHIDYTYMGSPAPVSEKMYYPTMCKGFYYLTKYFDVDLKIAAHPRSNYLNFETRYFEQYEVIYGRTAELVKNCKFVIGHSSTSIQFAILFKKPVIFVTTDEIMLTTYDKAIEKFAHEIGKTKINFDQDLDILNWEKELIICEEKYENYKIRYIKMKGTPEKGSWKIISQELSEKMEIERLSKGAPR